MSAPVTEAHRKLAADLCRNATGSNRALHHVPKFAQAIADSEALAVAEIAMVAAASADRNVSLRLERDQLRAELAQLQKNCTDIYNAGRKTEDQLRAEVERLKPYVSKAVLTHEGTMLCSPLVAVKFNEQTARAERAEAELADIRALANRRNKRDHSQDTTHQLVAALDQALDIAQAELAATKSTLDEEVNCAEKAEHEVVRQYARAERAEADLATAKAIIASIEEDGTEEHNAAVRLRQELAAERARLRQLALDSCRAAAIVPVVWYPTGYYVNPNDLGKINAQQVDACVAAIDAAMKEDDK